MREVIRNYLVSQKDVDEKYWYWRDYIMKELGEGTYAEVHASSDYWPYGDSYAHRDSDRDAWLKFLDENRLKYTVLWGRYGSMTILVKVRNAKGRKIKAWDIVNDALTKYDNYPVMDEDLWSEYQSKYEEKALEEYFTYRPMYGASISEAVGHVLANYPPAGWRYGETPCDEEIEAILRDTGYVWSRLFDAWVKTVEIELPNHTRLALVNWADQPTWGYAWFSESRPNNYGLYDQIYNFCFVDQRGKQVVVEVDGDLDMETFDK